jgi:hypothetical protein
LPHIGGVENRLTVGEPRLGLAAEVEHDLEQIAASLRETLRSRGDARRECREQQVELLFP